MSHISIQPNKICSDLSEKGRKAGFLSPRSSIITVTKEKERRKRKGKEKERRRRKKSNSCTFSFYSGYFGDFGRKKLLDAKGPIGDYVIAKSG